MKTKTVLKFMVGGSIGINIGFFISLVFPTWWGRDNIDLLQQSS
ncbi:hypothetical protein [Bombilactobacillus apium]|nr:hypothetical protein [Bombilactobacillus apium]